MKHKQDKNHKPAKKHGPGKAGRPAMPAVAAPRLGRRTAAAGWIKPAMLIPSRWTPVIMITDLLAYLWVLLAFGLLARWLSNILMDINNIRPIVSNLLIAMRGAVNVPSYAVESEADLALGMLHSMYLKAFLATVAIYVLGLLVYSLFKWVSWNLTKKQRFTLKSFV